eukprot:jgi/Mesvir1/12436/Mv00598-RA.3
MAPSSVVSDDDASSTSGVSVTGAVEQVPADRDAYLGKGHGWRERVFAVLYTLRKERRQLSHRLALFLVTVQYIQVFALLLAPNTGSWDINFDYWIIRWPFKLLLTNLVGSGSFKLFQGCFITNGVVLCISGLATAWIAVNRKPGATKLVSKALLFLITATAKLFTVYFGVFMVSCLDIFLAMSECSLHTLWGKEGDLRSIGRMVCDEKGSSVLGFVAAGVAVIYAAMAVLHELTTVDMNIMTDDMTGTMNCVALVLFASCKVLLVFAVRLLHPFPKVMGAALILCCLVPLVLIVQWQPYFARRMNRLMAFQYATLTLMATCIFRLGFYDDAHRFSKSGTSQLTIIMMALWVPVGGAGYLMLLWRSRRSLLVMRRFFSHTPVAPTVQEEDLYEFKTPWEVGVAATIVRLRLRKVNRKWEADPIHLDAAHLAFLTALEQHPRDPQLHFEFSCFARNLLPADSGITQVHMERARSMHPPLWLHFLIYVCDMERDKEGTEGGGSGNMDFSAYLEYMNNLRVALSTHREVLRVDRRFWRTVMQADVSFKQLAKFMASMRAKEATAERVYKGALEKHPRASKLLRAYGLFLEDIALQPELAIRFFRAADRIEDDAQEGTKQLDGQVDDSRDGVVVITRVGTIMHINRAAEKLFGHSGGDIQGKNVRILVPPPFNANHDAYLTAYNTTGKGRVMGGSRDLYARHKQGHLFPVRLFVNKVETAGQVNFMGVIRPLPEDPNPILTASDTGTITAINKAFRNSFGYSLEDTSSKPLTLILAEESLGGHAPGDWMQRVLSRGETAEAMALHRNGSEFPVKATVSVSRDQFGASMFFIHLLPMVSELGLMTIDTKGNILVANKFTQEIFGYREEKLLKMNVSALMPMPYSAFHDQYLERYAKKGPQGKVIGIPGGRTVLGLRANGTTFPMNLEVKEVKDPVTGARSFSGRITMVNPDVPDPRMTDLILDEEGEEVLRGGEGLQSVLGYEPEEIVGRQVNELLTLKAGARLDKMLADAEAANAAPTWRLRARTTRGPVSVILDLERSVEGPDSASTPVLRARLWNAVKLEGVVAIDAFGVIVEVTGGIGLFWGYRDEEMLDRNVSMLMTPKYGSQHNRFISAYRMTGKKKLLGTRRTVDAMHRDGTVFNAELEVHEAKAGGRRGRDSGSNREGDYTSFGDEGGAGKMAFIARFTLVANTEREATADDLTTDDSVDLGFKDKGKGATKEVKPKVKGGVRFADEMVEEVADKQAAEKEGEDESLLAIGGDKGEGQEPGKELKGKDAEKSVGAAPGGAAKQGLVPSEMPRGQAKASFMDRFLTDQMGATTLSPAFSGAGSTEDHPLLQEPAQQTHDHAVGENNSEDDHSESHGTSSDATSDNDEHSAAFKRARRCKVLLDRLHAEVAGTIQLLYKMGKFLVLALLVSFLIFFLLNFRLVNAVALYFDNMALAGATASDLLRICRNSRVLANMVGGAQTAPISYPLSVERSTRTKLVQCTVELEDEMTKLFLGEDSRIARRGWEKQNALLMSPVSMLEWQDTAGDDAYVMTHPSLWDALRMYVYYSRKVGMPQNRTMLALTGPWRYIIDNCLPLMPHAEALQDVQRERLSDYVEYVIKVLKILFAVEVGGVCVVGVAGLLYLLLQMARERVALFRVFLFIPRPTLRYLAALPIVLEVDGAAEEDSDEEHSASQSKRSDERSDEAEDEDRDATKKVDKSKRGPRGAGAGIGAGPVEVQLAAKKAVYLNPEGSKMIHFLYPVIVFALLVSACAGVGYFAMVNTRDPVYTANVALKKHWTARMIRHLTNEMALHGDYPDQTAAVGYRSVPGNPFVHNPHTREELKAMLYAAAVRFKRDHRGIFFGDPALGLKPALYRSTKVASLLFDFDCLRVDKSACLNKTHIYYPDANRGLDALIYTYARQAILFSRDSNAALNVSNERFKFITDMGSADLEDGMTKGRLTFVSEARALGERYLVVLSVVLAVVIVGLWWFYFRFLSPMLEATHAETQVVAKLLSVLPTNIKLDQILKDALTGTNDERNAGKPRKGKKGDEPAAKEAVKEKKPPMWQTFKAKMPDVNQILGI